MGLRRRSGETAPHSNSARAPPPPARAPPPPVRAPPPLPRPRPSRPGPAPTPSRGAAGAAGRVSEGRGDPGQPHRGHSGQGHCAPGPPGSGAGRGPPGTAQAVGGRRPDVPTLCCPTSGASTFTFRSAVAALLPTSVRGRPGASVAAVPDAGGRSLHREEGPPRGPAAPGGRRHSPPRARPVSLPLSPIEGLARCRLPFPPPPSAAGSQPLPTAGARGWRCYPIAAGDTKAQRGRGPRLRPPLAGAELPWPSALCQVTQG